MRQLHLARIFILFYICILARGVWAFFIQLPAVVVQFPVLLSCQLLNWLSHLDSPFIVWGELVNCFR